MDRPFPLDVEKWTWETIESLSDLSEGQYLEFKQSLHASDEESKKEWQRSLEREITAFANASGGVLVFGVSDDGNPSLFERPEHEVSQSVTRLIQNTTPLVDIDISEPIQPPGSENDWIALVVRVHKATRKPVTTGDSAVYIRINDRKEPMSREQMESMFVENDRRQQAIRQLEMEINRFTDVLTPPGKQIDIHGQAPPDFHLLNIESLKEVLRESTHLYADNEIREAINRTFEEIRGIEDREVYFGRIASGYMTHPYSTEERFLQNERRELKRRVDRLKQELGRLANAADLDVDFPEED